jgi:hypothetical protein
MTRMADGRPQVAGAGGPIRGAWCGAVPVASLYGAPYVRTTQDRGDRGHGEDLHVLPQPTHMMMYLSLFSKKKQRKQLRVFSAGTGKGIPSRYYVDLDLDLLRTVP